MHGCGKCFSCTSTRRDVWAARILLEACLYETTNFSTLTYEQANISTSNTLDPQDMTLFLKKLRKALSPTKMRYFYTGEYGTKFKRPHFHIITFGLSEAHEQLISDKWGNGYTQTRPLTPARARYCAKYSIKRSRKSQDEYIRNGLHPEFSRMSNKPGIAGNYAKRIATALKRAGYEANMTICAEALRKVNSHTWPATYRSMGNIYPLGRYLRLKVLDQLGEQNHKSVEGFELQETKVHLLKNNKTYQNENRKRRNATIQAHKHYHAKPLKL